MAPAVSAQQENNMKVNDIVSKMTNGAAHVILISEDTGEIILKTIWYHNIPHQYLSCEVKKIEIKDYEVRLTII